VTPAKAGSGTIPKVRGVIAKLRDWAEQTLPGRCLQRFLAINGTTLALVVAAQAFTAFIPLLIVVSSLNPAGSSAGVGGRLVERFHLSGDAASAVQTLFSRPPDSEGALTVLGVVLLVLSGLSLSRALQRAYEAAWDLPRSVRGTLNGVVALTILLTQIVLLALLAGLLRGVPAGSVATFVIRTGLTVFVWLVLQHMLLGGRISWRLLIPGAIFAAIGQQALSLFSAVWMPHVIEQNARRYGVIGVTFGLLSWLTAVGILLVGAAVVSAELGLSRQRQLDQHKADAAPADQAPVRHHPGRMTLAGDTAPSVVAEGGADMTSNPIQVFVAAFPTEAEAGEALKDFRAMDREGSMDLIDAAVVVRKADGKVTFEETADPSGKKWAKRGAIAGGLVGLIFPPSIIATAAVGAAGGGIWGKVRDKGFQDSDLKAIGESLEPGRSAIIAIAEDRMIERLQKGLQGYQNIARHAVSAEAAAIIVAEVDEEAADSAEASSSADTDGSSPTN